MTITSSSGNDFLFPDIRQTEAGKPRRVGVEIEFAGMDIADVAQVVARIFHGEIIKQTDYETTVANSELGDIQVELDVDFLKRIAQARKETAQESLSLAQLSEDVLANLIKQVAPCEVVTPPLPFTSLTELDRLTIALGEAGARGTDDAWFYAFGIHFNPEAPSLRPASLLAYLQAFVLLYDWLKTQLKVDPSRRLTPFIQPFSGDYMKLILQADYQPTQNQLIDDYMAFNPTRNRALDMLPIFTYLDPDRVLPAVNQWFPGTIKPRPTYHYRLPNSMIGDPQWRLTDEWRYWLKVENLAADHERLGAMAAAYLDKIQWPLSNFISSWAEETKKWLEKS